MTEVVGTSRDNARTLLVDGVTWLVYEHTPAFDRRRGTSLVFESLDVIRRVREYPQDWRAMSDVVLVELAGRPLLEITHRRTSDAVSLVTRELIRVDPPHVSEFHRDGDAAHVDAPASSVGGASMALVWFADARGVEWCVWSNTPPVDASVNGGLSAGWLTFASDRSRKRLAPIPDGWDRASDAKLVELCESATPVDQASRPSR